MRKLLVAVLGIVVVIALALVIGPRIVDLRPRIAAAVHEATGRDLRIDGELRVSLLPTVRVSAAGLHLSNAPGASVPEMVSIDHLALDAQLWSLLVGRLVVNSVVLTNPVVDLEVDKAGRANWVFAPAAAAGVASPPAAPQGQGAAWLGGLQLGNLSIVQGHLLYRDQTTGQTLDAKDLNVSAAMVETGSPLTLRGRMILNGEAVAANLSLDTLGKLSRGERAGVKLALDTKHATVKFDGTAQERPVAGLNGVFDLDVPSVSRLAAWLDQPLDKAQPDPGPLKVHAVFASEGAKSTLKEATLSGAGLNATATATLDATGDVTKVTAVVDSSVLDLDRYLPPQWRAAMARPGSSRRPAAAPGRGTDLLAGLSDRPFDLRALRKVDADIKVTIAGVRAMGYEVGHTALSATANRGVLTADLADLTLYGGNVKGRVKLEGGGDVLGVQASLNVDHVTVDKLARLAAGGPPPVTGVVSGTIEAAASGKSPRALAQNMRGHVAADLGGVTAQNTGARAISQLRLVVDVPGPDKPLNAKAGGVYNGQRIDAEATLAPLGKLLAGERFPAKLVATSSLGTLSYDGQVQQRPVPGLDGTIDADVTSVGKLAAWIGRPLAAAQPDPGPLKVHAALAADGTKLALKDAAITGKAIRATGRATLDAGPTPAVFNANVTVQQADLNAYLPPPRPGAAKAGPSDWSTVPFDLGMLAAANGKAEVSLAAVRFRDLDIASGAVTVTLANRVLKVATQRIALAQGMIETATTVDGSSGAAKLDTHIAVAGVQARPFLKTFAGSDRLGGTVAFETTVAGTGRSEKELVSSLSGSGSFKVTDGAIYGINLAQTLRKVGSLGFGGAETQKTDCAELSGTYTIRTGVIDNRDLKMLAPVLRVTGGGTVPMPPQTIDYALEAKLVGTLAGQGGQDALAGLPIPIRVTGPWSAPDYRVDWTGVFRSIASDPTRLKALPTDLRNAAKNFGVPLTIPGGTAPVVPTKPGDLLKQLPGISQVPAPGTPPAAPPADKQKKEPTLPFNLPGLFGK